MGGGDSRRKGSIPSEKGKYCTSELIRLRDFQGRGRLGAGISSRRGQGFLAQEGEFLAQRTQKNELLGPCSEKHPFNRVVSGAIGHSD